MDGIHKSGELTGWNLFIVATKVKVSTTGGLFATTNELAFLPSCSCLVAFVICVDRKPVPNWEEWAKFYQQQHQLDYQKEYGNCCKYLK